MGAEIDRIDFTPEDFLRFQEKLNEQLCQLKQQLQKPDFGLITPSLGTEVELYLVDEAGRPLPANEKILSLADNPQLTPELNSYNLEYNSPPFLLSNSPFLYLERTLEQQLKALNDYAATIDGRVLAIGILPTLRKTDFGLPFVTPKKRYYALIEQLIKQRGSDFEIHINGEQPLRYQFADITLEGANTSFQIHYTVPPKNYTDTYNTAQLMTPLAIAVGANSPTLFGHTLWDETRIPLFKQSIDTRHIDRYQWNEPARVNFGHGWLRHGAWELFAESVNLYRPILPIISHSAIDEQQAPLFSELCLHQSTVWLWNRPVYDHSNGGHLRIEMRSLPSGPTPVDMTANTAFLLGMIAGQQHRINDLLPAIPFQTAVYNFYRSAQFSLDAQLIWPQSNGSYQRQSIIAILENSLSIAEQGLQKLGIPHQEYQQYLNVIEDRIKRHQNGAIWQKETLKKLHQQYNLEESLHKMLELFIANASTNTPVSRWPIAGRLS